LRQRCRGGGALPPRCTTNQHYAVTPSTATWQPACGCRRAGAYTCDLQDLRTAALRPWAYCENGCLLLFSSTSSALNSSKYYAQAFGTRRGWGWHNWVLRAGLRSSTHRYRQCRTTLPREPLQPRPHAAYNDISFAPILHGGRRLSPVSAFHAAASGITFYMRCSSTERAGYCATAITTTYHAASTSPRGSLLAVLAEPPLLLKTASTGLFLAEQRSTTTLLRARAPDHRRRCVARADAAGPRYRLTAREKPLCAGTRHCDNAA